jgi:peroxiredoxin
MSEKSTFSPLKITTFVVLVFLVGVAGVFVGTYLRDHLSGKKRTIMTTRAPRSLLTRGMVFPEVEVVDENGTARGTGEVMGGEGCVVVFLDLECPPCVDLSRKWQRALDDGKVERGRVWGVTYHPQEIINEFKKDHDIRFPIFTDVQRTFLREYEVDRFPLEIVIGGSGRIRSASYDSERTLDFLQLAKMFAE